MPDLAEIGFDRPKEKNLRGTVKLYQRHLFVCTGHIGWPSHIERAGGFTEALAQAIAAQETALPGIVKINACDEPGRGDGHDLLVFPDMVRYIGLHTADLPVLVADHLAGGAVSERLAHEPIGGCHVFVCVHQARDERCGYCGPILADLLAREIARRDLGDQIRLHRTSHVGGHQYAGNVLIYPEGDWYGYVTPADVPRIIEQHILRGKLVAELWRGRMGLTEEEQLWWLNPPPG